VLFRLAFSHRALWEFGGVIVSKEKKEGIELKSAAALQVLHLFLCVFYCDYLWSFLLLTGLLLSSFSGWFSYCAADIS
jgi:hypothetical protein